MASVNSRPRRTTTTTTEYSDFGTGSWSKEGVCDCGLLIKQHTAKTPLNFGRRFVRCPRRREEQCGFFKWLDDPIHQQGYDETLPQLAAEINNVRVRADNMEAELVKLKLVTYGSLFVSFILFVAIAAVLFAK